MDTSKKQLLVAVVIAAVLAGGVGYEAGKTYGKSSASAQVTGAGNFGDRTGTGRTGGQRGVNAGRGFGNATMGEVLSIDGGSLTIKLRDGGSKIVFYGSSTPVMRTASGTISDLSVGEQVFISGNTNPDGSVTAESIQLRPAGGPTGR